MLHTLHTLIELIHIYAFYTPLRTFCKGTVKALPGCVAMEDTQSTVSSAIAQMLSDSLHSFNLDNMRFDMRGVLPFIITIHIHLSRALISHVERNKHVLKS